MSNDGGQHRIGTFGELVGLMRSAAAPVRPTRSLGLRRPFRIRLPVLRHGTDRRRPRYCSVAFDGHADRRHSPTPRRNQRRRSTRTVPHASRTTRSPPRRNTPTARHRRLTHKGHQHDLHRSLDRSVRMAACHAAPAQASGRSIDARREILCSSATPSWVFSYRMTATVAARFILPNRQAR